MTVMAVQGAWTNRYGNVLADGGFAVNNTNREGSRSK